MLQPESQPNSTSLLQVASSEAESCKWRGEGGSWRWAVPEDWKHRKTKSSAPFCGFCCWVKPHCCHHPSAVSPIWVLGSWQESCETPSPWESSVRMCQLTWELLSAGAGPWGIPATDSQLIICCVCSVTERPSSQKQSHFSWKFFLHWPIWANPAVNMMEKPRHTVRHPKVCEYCRQDNLILSELTWWPSLLTSLPHDALPTSLSTKALDPGQISSLGAEHSKSQATLGRREEFPVLNCEVI